MRRHTAPGRGRQLAPSRRLRHLTSASLPELAGISRLFVLTLAAPLAHGDAEGGELAPSVARFHEVTPAMVEDVVRGMPFCDLELEHEGFHQLHI